MSSEAAEPGPYEELTLENLCDDCLDRIFRYLPLPDLLNVADTSKQLKIVADLTFSSQYGKKIVSIYGFTSDPYYCWSSLSHWLVTANLKIMLQLLRCFGHLVHRMRIELLQNLIDDITSIDINFEHLMFYVTEYCIESLTEFTLLGVDLKEGSLRHFLKPFSNIHTLSLQSSDLKSLSLIELFPKMQRLTYRCERMHELVAIARDLQSLDHLEIITDETWEKWDASLKRSILHLRSLAMPYNLIFPSMFSFDSFANLQDFKVNSMPNRQITPVQFHLKSVNKLRIFYYEHAISSFPWIPFSFDNLTELDLQFNAVNTYQLETSPEPFYDYILRYPTILKLRVASVPGLLSLRRLMSILPLLEQAELIGVFATDDIIHFMNKAKTLKYLRIRFASISETLVNDVKCQLEFGDEWCGKQTHINTCEFTRIPKAVSIT